jgi:hypothetical protein
MEASITTASNQRPPLMEINGGTVALPVFVNQLEKTKKKEKIVHRPAEPIHGPTKPIHRPLPP